MQKNSSAFHRNHKTVLEDRKPVQDSIKPKEWETCLSVSTSIFTMLILRGFKFSQLHVSHADKSSVAKN